MKIVYFILLIFFFQACSYNNKFKKYNISNHFTISIPDYMKPCKDISNNAAVQYKNAYRNTYCIVLQDSKDLPFIKYQQKSLSILKNYQELKKPIVTDSTYIYNDTNKYIAIQLYGIMNDENIYYWHNTYEGKKYFYQVVCWTRSMDRKQRYGEDLEHILKSFKPLL